MRNRFTLLVILLFCLPMGVVIAQLPALTPSRTPAPVDSTRIIEQRSDTLPDVVPGGSIRVGTSVLTADSTSLSVDTARVTDKQEAQIRKIIPRQATIRSLIFPGLGQAYNRQYYKMPFVYGGFAAIGYFFVRYRRLANEAETGYRRLLYGDPNPAGGDNTPVTAVEINNAIFTTTTGAKNAYDFYRRYRDTNIILAVALYALTAVEANVAAHLKTFDLSDDISMRIEPAMLPAPGVGIVPGMRVAMTFK